MIYRTHQLNIESNGMIYIPKYFKLPELLVTNSDLDNSPSWEAIINLSTLCEHVLDPIRIAFKRPIHVNSGFRSIKVNEAIGGAKNSQHCNGEAVDITAGDKKINKELFDLILSSGIGFDQCIDEKNYQWIHIAYSSIHNRKQILHLK